MTIPTPIKIERSASTPGRKPTVDPNKVVQWRIDNKASQRETAEHFGISIWTVRDVWRKAGMAGHSPVPTGGTRFKKDWKAIADYREKLQASVSETCRVFGVAHTTVTRACKAYGVDLSHKIGAVR
jgi:DNA invertase Pin-like site-specific DNA recombinase